MKLRHLFVAALLVSLLSVAFIASSEAAGVTIIVELQDSSKLDAVTSALNATVLDTIPGTPTYLMRVPTFPTVSDLIKAVLGIKSLELNLNVKLPSFYQLGVLGLPPGAAPDWYRHQPVFQQIQAGQAQQIANGYGIVVADINSAVDRAHPALRLTGGYDFVAERSPGGADLNQSSAGFMDQSSAGFMDQSSAGFMDQSSAGFMDGTPAAGLIFGVNAAYSHGTLCAGLISAAAPGAMVMPLRVFDDQGNADTFGLTKAIRYAANNGANVINMSFGTLADSPAMRSAINYAANKDIVLVASAGNNNTSAPQWPAKYSKVIAVAATNTLDQKGTFSNYGSHVFISAPGVNVFSAYPGGHYSIATGTSFSAPIVAGAVALLQSQSRSGVSDALAGGAVNIDGQNPGYQGLLGHGRLNILRAFQTR